MQKYTFYQSWKIRMMQFIMKMYTSLPKNKKKKNSTMKLNLQHNIKKIRNYSRNSTV